MGRRGAWGKEKLGERETSLHHKKNKTRKKEKKLIKMKPQPSLCLVSPTFLLSPFFVWLFYDHHEDSGHVLFTVHCG